MTNEPIYVQIENYLRNLIQSKKIMEGELLPSENQLCDMFGVTRMTVRFALSNLVTEGYIIKRRGVGSVVIANKIYDNISKVSGFVKEMTEKGFGVSTIVKKMNVIQADSKIASKLNINIGENVWEIGRIRLANDKKVSYMHTYMPLKMFCELNKSDCESSLYEYIEKVSKCKIITSERTIQAIIATDELKKILDLKYNEPILHIEQVSKLSNDEIFEYSHTFHYNYKLTLKAINE